MAQAGPGAGKAVLMALSGGVDSAAGVALLQQQGYVVSALCIRFSPAHDGAVAAARRAAEELGIPFHLADATAAFEEAVIAPFCRAYAAGRTPNPCVVCNPLVKFRVLAAEADRLGIPLIATGHYARLVQQAGRCMVARAHSHQRDQSYMLYRLSQPVLGRLILPAGRQDKTKLRDLAARQGLSSAGAPDSQEICFIPGGDYAGYILARGHRGAAGHFIGPEGQDLGPHKGVLHYTVGQRRGLGVALGRPVFVKAIAASGNIALAYDEGVYARGVRLHQLAGPAGAGRQHSLLAPGAYTVKIRSMAQPTPCRFAWVTTAAAGTQDAAGAATLSGDDGAMAEVYFDTPQRAPAPGQHAVLYQGDVVVGGGVIDTVL